MKKIVIKKKENVIIYDLFMNYDGVDTDFTTEPRFSIKLLCSI